MQRSFPTITSQLPPPAITLWLPLSPLSHYSPPPMSPNPHNGNLSACEWKTSHLRRVATVSVIVCTNPPLLLSNFQCIFRTLRFSDLVSYFAILKTLQVEIENQARMWREVGRCKIGTKYFFSSLPWITFLAG